MRVENERMTEKQIEPSEGSDVRCIQRPTHLYMSDKAQLNQRQHRWNKERNRLGNSKACHVMNAINTLKERTRKQGHRNKEDFHGVSLAAINADWFLLAIVPMRFTDDVNVNGNGAYTPSRCPLGREKKLKFIVW